jgi:hypothetical protein
MRKVTLCIAVLTLFGCEAVEDPADFAPDGGASADGGSPPPGAITCGNDDLASCSAGACRVHSTGGSLPAGTVLTLAERLVPAELIADADGSVVCEVALPSGATAALWLSIDLGGTTPAPGTKTLFVDAPSGPIAYVSSSTSDTKVIGALRHSGVYGVTERPSLWGVEQAIEHDPPLVTDGITFLRNVSSQRIGAAFYDGTHFYLASGNRILAYDGLPALPTTQPARVLGRPDLSTNLTGTTSSIFNGGVNALWADGNHLAAADGHRVLLWNAPPQTSFAPADVVLGQADFATSKANVGGISASTLSFPQSIDSDGTRLLVADTLNHRVLAWDSFPTRVGEPATRVIGQGNFEDAIIYGGATPLYQAWAAKLDATGIFVASIYTGTFHVASNVPNPPADFAIFGHEARVDATSAPLPRALAYTASGGLAIADDTALRVAMLRTRPTGSPPAIDFVLGSPDPERAILGPATAASFDRRTGSFSLMGSGGLFGVLDGYRLLVWDSAPTYTFEPASRVFGQAGFTTNEPRLDYRRIGATTLASPSAIAMNATHVAVADRGNNRVLLYPRASLGQANLAATIVLGQPDARSFIPNLDQATPSAARMSGPAGVTFAGSRLVVADAENHRVLVWNSMPTTTAQPADLVLGQSDFSGRRPNRGRGDANLDGYSDAAADGFFYPSGVASDGTRLFVADSVNHRILVWDTFPTTQGQAADRVIGQATFTALRANRGDGWAHPRADGFDSPTALLLDGDSLWIADTENYRVLRLDGVSAAPTVGLVLGQPDATSLTNPAAYPPGSYNQGSPWGIPPTTATSVLRPRGLALAGGRLYVSESDSSRVHVFDGATGASLSGLGQSSLVDGAPNSYGIGATTLARPEGLASDGTVLLVADASNHRVLGWSVTTLPAVGAPATVLVGQQTMVETGFNQAMAQSAGGNVRPRGLARAGTSLYTAESDHHRVIVRGLPIAGPGAPITRIYGQPNDTLILANSGGAPSARTLRSPRGVFADDTRVVITDTGNHRVLIFDRASPSADATLVVGQSSFAAGAPNGGGGASASTLLTPEAATIYEGKLIVADAGNHRVLIWNTLPTANGQPADVILGQAGASDALSNRGLAAPTGATMASPSGVDAAGGALFVADSGNNRVLVYPTFPTTTGTPAAHALGQPDLTSRVPSYVPTDVTRHAGPGALTHDGSNLYVTDRDAARVVVHSLRVVSKGPAPAIGVLGAGGGAMMTAPAGIAVESLDHFQSRVYVSDTLGDRVLVLSPVPRARVE